MKNNERIFLGVTAVMMVTVCCLFGLRMLYHNDANISGPIIDNSEEQQEIEEPKKQEKVYVNVFFIGQNANKEEVYKAVNREYDENIDGSKINFAMHSLIAGPKLDEKSKGVYTEIPAGTKIISIQENPDKVIVNLNGAFETGGGTESIYKRLYQLIKTAKYNTAKPVYLYINGTQAEVIGGEGIMITQPLSDSSPEG